MSFYYNDLELGYREFLLNEFSRTYVSLLNKVSNYYQLLSIKGKRKYICFKLLTSIFADLYKIQQLVSLYLKERKSVLNKTNYNEGVKKVKKMEELLNNIYKNIIIWKVCLSKNFETDYKYESLKEINEYINLFNELNIIIGIFTQKTPKLKEEKENEDNSLPEEKEYFLKKITIN